MLNKPLLVRTGASGEVFKALVTFTLEQNPENPEEGPYTLVDGQIKAIDVRGSGNLNMYRMLESDITNFDEAILIPDHGGKTYAYFNASYPHFGQVYMQLVTYLRVDGRGVEVKRTNPANLSGSRAELEFEKVPNHLFVDGYTVSFLLDSAVFD